MNTTEQTLKTIFTNKDLEAIKCFAQSKINDTIHPAYIIHNWDNTLNLIKTAEYLKKKESVNKDVGKELDALLYFYNIGYVINPKDPIDTSANIAVEYLNENNFDSSLVEKIGNGIKSMHKNNSAVIQSVAIAQDTINAYLGQKRIQDRVKSRFEEYNIAKDKAIDEVMWIDQTIESMTQHRYNTKAATKKWAKRKEKNINKLRRYLYQLKRDSSLTYNKRAMTMFKTASRNQIDLINIADKKAGIMITVNAVLITIMLPLFASYVIDISRFLVPSIILIATCGTSIILATLATKPIFKKDPKKEDFLSGNRSLFFFRNFIHLNKEEYKTAVHELIVRDTPFENAVITDLYDLGKTLGVKYKKLTWCYWVFAIGIGLTIITFMFCMMYVEGF